MSKKEHSFLYDDKIIYGYIGINLDFVKPIKDCNQGCNNLTNYACFDCLTDQVKNKYPNSIYTDDCEWIIKKR